jgi:hypothetical protein
MRLAQEDLRRFGEDGYLVIRDVVPEALLAAADEEAAHLMAEREPDEGNRGPGQNAWFAPIAQLPRCDDVLRKSPALAIANELVAPNTIDHAGFDSPRYAITQIAITIPQWSHIPGGPHIDGWVPGDSFTMLAGVLLTDQRETQTGNLWVWPGSHLVHQQMFRERGIDVLHATGSQGHPTLLDPPVRLGPPVPILGQRGDLVLAHFLLGHNKGGNTAGHVRRTIYYRLSVPGHAQRADQTRLDAWLDYPAVRASLTAARRET